MRRSSWHARGHGISLQAHQRKEQSAFVCVVDRGPPHEVSSPQSSITTGLDVFPLCEPTASIFFTISMPSVTLPNTQCLPSSQAVFTVHRKNWEPFVLGPAFAM